MARASELVSPNIEGYLRSLEQKPLLRFITCGSVDDGKSTLIGRLLYESKMIFEDQLAALTADSKKMGTRGGELDFALLVDGLSAEREQGITIDVAYRFFSTDKRKFIVADTPGHEQYTRNMITGASTADLAIVLIDARKRVLTQTRRHSYLVSLLGIRRVVLAVNKMDLVGYSRDVFDSIERDYREFAVRIGIPDVTCIPISAVHGHNIVKLAAAEMPWYDGPTLLEHLENIPVGDDVSSKPFRLPVQWVNRPNRDFRGFAGVIVSGTARVGDQVSVLPSGRRSQIARILVGDRESDTGVSGQSVTVTLTDETDVSRGDVLAASNAQPAVADQFEATLVWMHDQRLLQGRSYLMKIGTQTVTATVAPIKYKINVNTLEHVAAKDLELNEIGVCCLELSQPIVFEPYRENRDLGGFILVDRLTNGTVGAGLLHFALRRSQNVHWQALDVNKAARADLKGQKPCVVWFTGLSGAGKSTIANLVEKRLHALGRHTYILDGDNVRHGLNKDLGFTDADRVENIRRVAEVSRLMVDAGLIVLVSFISPFRAERRMARDLLRPDEFFEVFVQAPLEIAETRDPKGLYKKARRGELKNFTGIDSPYEEPERPEMRIDTTRLTPEQAADVISRTAATSGHHRGRLTIGHQMSLSRAQESSSRVYREERVATSASSQPRRILYVLGGGRVGGMETHLLRLLAALDRNRFSAVVCCVNGGTNYRLQLASAADRVENLQIDRFNGPLKLCTYVRALSRVFARWKPHIVQTYGYGSDVLVPFLARLLCPGAMVVTTRRGVDENPRHQMLRKMANRYVDSVVCVSASVASFTKATERIDTDKLRIIPNESNYQSWDVCHVRGRSP